MTMSKSFTAQRSSAAFPFGDAVDSGGPTLSSLRLFPRALFFYQVLSNKHRLPRGLGGIRFSRNWCRSYVLALTGWMDSLDLAGSPPLAFALRNRPLIIWNCSQQHSHFSFSDFSFLSLFQFLSCTLTLARKTLLWDRRPLIGAVNVDTPLRV